MAIEATKDCGPATDLAIGAYSTDSIGSYYVGTADGPVLLPAPIVLALNAIHPVADVSFLVSLIDHTVTVTDAPLITVDEDVLYRLEFYANSSGAGASASTLTLSFAFNDNYGRQTHISFTDLPLDVVAEKSGKVMLLLTNGTELTYTAEITGGLGAEMYSLILFFERAVGITL